MENWVQISLGELLRFSNGRSSPQRREAATYPVFGSNGVIGFADETNADAQTIIVGRVGSYCGSLHFSDQPCWVTDNAIKAQPLGENVSKFLFYLLTRLDLNSRRAGSGQPLLNQEILSAIVVRVPKPSEQRAIAGVLGALDDKIEASRRMNATLEALARALFKSWFVDFDPVRAKMEGRAPALAPDLAALFPARLTDSPLGPIPEGWEVKTLTGIAELCRDTVDPAKLGEESVAHFSIPAFDAGQMPVIEAASNIASTKALVSNERVLFSKLNPEINRVWPITTDSNVPMLASTEFLVLAPKAPISVAWLTLLLTSPQFRSVSGGMTTGTSKSHQRIQPQSLMAIDVICPATAVLAGAEQVLRPMLLRVEANRQQSRTLAQLRDLLLPKLLSGALRVRDAERMIGDAA